MELFFENMKSAGTQVVVLYVMVAVGFVCDKVKIFSEETAKKVVDLLLYIITPSLLISSFINMERTQDNIKKFFLSLGLMFLIHIIAIALFASFFRKKDMQDPVFKFGSIYGNTGYMALPLAQAVLGDIGVFYCANGVAAYNVMTFTHGVRLMKSENEKLKLKALILNPGVIAILIGLPIFLLNIPVPYVIAKPVELIGSLNSPVAMLIFGTYLSRTNLLNMFKIKKIYLVALLKLIVMPLACMGVFALCGISGTLLTACAITASVPSGNNTFMFASKYGKDAAVASQMVALVSFMSVITMPVMIAASQSI